MVYNGCYLLIKVPRATSTKVRIKNKENEIEKDSVFNDTELSLAT